MGPARHGTHGHQGFEGGQRIARGMPACNVAGCKAGAPFATQAAHLARPESYQRNMRYLIGLLFAIGCRSASGIEGDGSLESSSEAGETDTTARGEDDAEVGESGGGSSEESGDAAVPVHRIADLVGQPCGKMGELRICALNQSRAQVCGWWDDELRWTACERSIECVPGEILDRARRASTSQRTERVSRCRLAIA